MILRNAIVLGAIGCWLAAAAVSAAPTPRGTLTLGNQTGGIALDPVLARAFVTNTLDGTVSVIDIPTLSIAATVPAGPSPRGILADAATHRVYIVNDASPGSLPVLDGATLGIIATIGVGNDPRHLGENFFLREVYVSNHGSNTLSMISTPYAGECASLQTGTTWQLESASVYYIALPDLATGNCAAGTSPLYRVYNNGQGGAPNHRYTADRAIRSAMVAQGWIPEGSGPDSVFACTPTLRGV